MENATVKDCETATYANDAFEDKMWLLAQEICPRSAIFSDWVALCSAMAAAYRLGAAEATAEVKEQKQTKRELLFGLMRRPKGATTFELAAAAGWALNTVRSFLSAETSAGTKITKIYTRQVGPNKTGAPGSYTTYFLK